jgi:hypothetical protein
MKHLLNWRALSKELTGNPLIIKKQYTPIKHREKVNKILETIKTIIDE